MNTAQQTSTHTPSPTALFLYAEAAANTNTGETSADDAELSEGETPAVPARRSFPDHLDLALYMSAMELYNMVEASRVERGELHGGSIDTSWGSSSSKSNSGVATPASGDGDDEIEIVTPKHTAAPPPPPSPSVTSSSRELLSGLGQECRSPPPPPRLAIRQASPKQETPFSLPSSWGRPPAKPDPPQADPSTRRTRSAPAPESDEDEPNPKRHCASVP